MLSGWLGTAFGTDQGRAIDAYLPVTGSPASACVSFVYLHVSAMSYPSQVQDLCSLAHLFKISIWM